MADVFFDGLDEPDSENGKSDMHTTSIATEMSAEYVIDDSPNDYEEQIDTKNMNKNTKDKPQASVTEAHSSASVKSREELSEESSRDGQLTYPDESRNNGEIDSEWQDFLRNLEHEGGISISDRKSVKIDAEIVETFKLCGKKQLTNLINAALRTYLLSHREKFIAIRQEKESKYKPLF